MAESGLFKGLRRIQIKKFFLAIKTRSGCKKRHSVLPAAWTRNSLQAGSSSGTILASLSDFGKQMSTA